DQPTDTAADAVLDIGTPTIGRQAVNFEGAGLVTAFFPDSARGDVSHDVVGVTVDPGVRAVLLFVPQGVVDANFAAERDPKLVGPKLPHLDRVFGIGMLEGAALVGFGQQAPGPAGAVIGAFANGFQLGFGGLLAEVERDEFEPGAEPRRDGAHGMLEN